MSISTEERERYQRYLCSREWAVLKEQVHKRSRGICERCKFNAMDHVHHLTYARKYHELLTDLEARCVGCHEFTHGKRDRDPILNVPVMLGGVHIKGVYLAGRMDKANEWRQEITPCWSQSSAEGPEWVWLPCGRKIRFFGPTWFNLYGHGRGEGPHRAADDWDDNFSGHSGADTLGTEWSITTPRKVLSHKRMEMVCATLLFAWIDSRECFGTIAEIGYFHGLQREKSGRHIVVATPQWDQEMWFAFTMADQFIIAPSAGVAWLRALNGERDPLGMISSATPESQEEDIEQEEIWNHA